MSTVLALIASALILAVFAPLREPGLLMGSVVVVVVWLLWLANRPTRTLPAQQVTQEADVVASNVSTPSRQPEARPPVTTKSAVATRRPKTGSSQLEHYRRHATTPGWIYVFRNDLHAPDVYKVGYTTAGTSVRLRFMNDQVRGVTAAVGEFRVVYERPVPESYNAEQQVFARLAMFRARSNREFFQAPLEVIKSAIDAVADEALGVTARPALPPRIVYVSCPGCGRAQRVTVDPAVQWVDLSCPPCGHQWSEDAPAGEGRGTIGHGASSPLQAWSPPGMDPALAAVKVPRGEVAEAQWWSALADRLTTMVLAEPDPEAAAAWAARVLGQPEPDSPQQAGEAILEHNLERQTAMRLSVADSPFPTKVVIGVNSALVAIEETDLEQWVNLAASMGSVSSLD